MAHGRRNQEIRARLHLTESTLSHHITIIYHKLGVVTRSQAVIAAIRAGLVDPRAPEGAYCEETSSQ
jgi:DNA-binding CsgD family transcriptional regulator